MKAQPVGRASVGGENCCFKLISKLQWLLNARKRSAQTRTRAVIALRVIAPHRRRARGWKNVTKASLPGWRSWKPS